MHRRALYLSAIIVLVVAIIGVIIALVTSPYIQQRFRVMEPTCSQPPCEPILDNVAGSRSQTGQPVPMDSRIGLALGVIIALTLLEVGIFLRKK